jgi:hypothetical protein
MLSPNQFFKPNRQDFTGIHAKHAVTSCGMDALSWVRLKILVASTKYFFNFLYDNHPQTLGEEGGEGRGVGEFE